MITNNVTVESQLATSAATFLKWEEVYIFCFLQSETLELGDPRIGTLPLCLPLVRVCLVALSSPSGAFSFHCDPICRGEFICCLSPAFRPSLFPRSVSSFCSVYLSLPCSCSLPNSKAFLKCRASLSIEPVSPSNPLLEALLRSPALSLISGYLQRECASVCVCVWDNVHVKKRGGEGNKSTILYVDSGTLFFYAKETGRLKNRDNTCMIKWKLKPCLKEYFTQRV